MYRKRLRAAIEGVGAWAFLVYDTVRFSLRRPPSWPLLLEQLYQIGVLSVPVVAITGFSTGLVLAAQSFYQLADKGLASATGLLVTEAMLTEIGPVLTAFMVTGRVGSSMCAVLGTMRVTEQIDALHSMAVHPLRHLVFPRLLGGFAMLPLLTIFSSVMGILGGYLISVYYFGMASQSYFEPLQTHVSDFDVATGIIKAFFFGFLISTISCYKGMTASGGASGVGRQITQSVVICYSCILISNFLMTVLLNTLHILFVERL